ncbi:MAG: endolytic transglycosylase MltG [Solirubrobacteraceae bacterium]
MSPLFGRGGRSKSPPRRPAHPAAGGDWAEDLDWTDPRTDEHEALEQNRVVDGLVRWSDRRRVARADRPPRSPRQRRIIVRRTIASLIVCVLGFAIWFLVSLYQPFHGSGRGSVTVSIPSGASGSQVADLLSRDGVISSSFFFGLRASLDGDSSKFRSGVYTLKRNMSYSSALSALMKPGGSEEVALTIPEGLTRAQIAVLAKKAGLRGNYLRASTPKAAGFSPQAWGAHRGVNSLEGFLFPDTYYLYRHGSVSSLVAKQLAAFKQAFAQVNVRYAHSRDLTDYDVVTIASIIEREAQLTSDGPKVAAVIYNRLREGIQLGLDTTLLYYLHNPKGGLTEKDLAMHTPYNTRLNFGLPPTPIANPGSQALDAAADPSRDQQLLYFVVKPNACGALAFATNITAFDQEVAAYNAAVKADHGAFPAGCGRSSLSGAGQTQAKSKHAKSASHTVKRKKK